MSEKFYTWSGICVFGLLMVGLVAFQRPSKQGFVQLVDKAAQHAEKLEVDTALYYYNQAVRLYKQQQNLRDAVALYRPMYSLYNNGIDYEILTIEDFEVFIRGAAADVFKINEPQFLAEFYLANAELALQKGGIPDTVEYYANLSEQLNNVAADRHLYLLKGYTLCMHSFYLENNLKKAHTYLTKGSALVQQYPNLEKSIYANEFFSIRGAISYALSDVEAALSDFSKCLVMTESSQSIDTLSLVADYNNLASMYGELGDSEKELIYYQKVISLVEQAHLSEEELVVPFVNMALMHSNRQAYKQAAEYLKKAKALAKKYNMHSSELTAQLALVKNIYPTNLDSAKLLRDELLSLHAKYKNTATIHATYDLCVLIAVEDKNYLEALRYAQLGLASAQAKYGNKSQLVSTAYKRMGESYTGLDQYEEALKCYQKALEALSLDFVSKSYTDAPAVESVSNKVTFMSILQERIVALQGFRRTNPNAINVEDIYAQSKLAIQALQSYQRNLSLASKEFALSLHAAKYYSQAVDLAVELYVNTKNPQFLEEAFTLSEQSKSSLLLESMNAEHLGGAGVPDSLLKREKELANLITQIEKQRFDAVLRKDSVGIEFQDELLFKYRRESDLLQNKLQTEYSKYYNEKYNVQIASSAQIQDQLNNETALLEYFASDSAYYIFVLQQDKFEVKQIALTDSLNTRLMKYQQSLMSARSASQEPAKTYNIFLQESYYLYQTFVEPALQGLTAKRLIVIPDGYLGYIPFESFVIEPSKSVDTNKDADYSQLPYLLHKYIVNYNYSATLWQEQLAQENKVVSTSCLGMAATYKNRSVPANRSLRERQLRRVMNELTGVVDEIAFLKENWSGEFFTDTAATEQAFREHASQHGILHLAMHGIVDEENPEYSSLAFSENGDTLNDNFLYAYEIKQLDLNAALVVLSACETAAGKYLHGEGILSLGRGFMYAGAPSLLTTLWQLNDQAGAALIKAFYENLRAHMDKDEAIRQAKIAYLQQMQGAAAHPALWACFIQVGDYRPLETRSNTSIVIYAGAGGLLALLAVGWWKMRQRNQLD